MTNEIIENNDSENVEEVEEEVIETPEEKIEEDESEAEIEENESEQDIDLKARIAELEKENKTLKVQKAKIKEKKAAPVEQEKAELSQKELYSLMQNNVHEDDIDQVVDYAQARKISVQEALQSGTIKAILKENQELRKTQELSNTGTTRKSSAEKDADTLIQKARKGEMPQSEADMKKMFLKMKGIE